MSPLQPNRQKHLKTNEKMATQLKKPAPTKITYKTDQDYKPETDSESDGSDSDCDYSNRLKLGNSRVNPQG
jgi:hypothetical protein